MTKFELKLNLAHLIFVFEAKFICMVVLLGCFHASYSQYWHHNKVVSKQSEKPVIETAPPYFNNKNIVQKLEKQYLQQQDLQPLNGVTIFVQKTIVYFEN